MKIVLYTMSMEQGGAQRVIGLLANGFKEHGFDVSLILDKAYGPFLSQIHKQVRIYDLKLPSKSLKYYGTLKYLSIRHSNYFDLDIIAKLSFLGRQSAGFIQNSWMRYLLSYIFRATKLAIYLRSLRPNIFISALTEWNIIAILAKILSKEKYALILSEHTYLPMRLKYHPAGPLVALLVRKFYPFANKIVTVSKELKDVLQKFLCIDRIIVIYNPVITPELFVKAQEFVNHDWFVKRHKPIILGVGRLTASKDFATLLRSFALVNQTYSAHLVILGEGEERTNLEQLAKDLGIQDNISMPGFVENPFAYMARASVFTLSSLYEALPTVLIEALACGCPVVSTDCRSGPREILDDGRYGRLVPVSNPEAMAKAILETLEDPDKPADRKTRIQRAMEFSVDAAVSRYVSLISELTETS